VRLLAQRAMNVFEQALCLPVAFARDDAYIVGQDDESFFLPDNQQASNNSSSGMPE